jgi:alkylation response protein AidB-like acyl-CoA dehydrogenase
VARRDGGDDWYRITGQKHFGSGSGITSFMVTSAMPEGEDKVDWFFFDMQGVPWDGSKGVKLVAPWDGYGMIATQSHGMTFEDFPATRTAWPYGAETWGKARGGVVPCLFTAVIVGVVESAVETARVQLRAKKDSMRPYEKTEWARVEIAAWQIQQSYEGMLRAHEEPRSTTKGFSALLGKTAIAELAEDTLTRISRIIGGGSFSRNVPYSQWQEDSRALGFLRPPWGFAFDQIFDQCWTAP